MNDTSREKTLDDAMLQGMTWIESPLLAAENRYVHDTKATCPDCRGLGYVSDGAEDATLCENGKFHDPNLDPTDDLYEAQRDERREGDEEPQTK